MATVYLARDLRHERPVALKVLHPELGAPLGPERFLREVETAARLQHPHILPVFDSGEAAGRLWYTMPYVEGETLRDRLQREAQLPVEDAVRLTREVAEALDYAHRHGVVHRDIKPENILLTDGHALVADFGIAKALRRRRARALTQTGMAVGTPAYMSPEQASRRPGSTAAPTCTRSAACSTRCSRASRRSPGRRRRPAIARQRAGAAPLPAQSCAPACRAPLERAVTAGLAKAPADRFQTAGEFARALSTPTSAGALARPAAYGAEAPSATTRLHRRRVPAGLATLAIGILLGLGGAIRLVAHRPEAGAAGPKRLAVLPFENLGRPEDEYFADGVTDAVRGKLTALPGLQVIARASSSPVQADHEEPAADRAGAGRRLPADGHGALGAGGQGGQSRVQVSPELVQVSHRRDPVASALRGSAHRRVPGAGPNRRPGGRGARRGARRGRARATRRAADSEPGRVRRLPAGRGGGRWERHHGPGGAPAGARLLRAGGGPRLELRPRLGPALAGVLALYWSAPNPAAAAAARRAAERSLALAPKRPDGLSGARQLLRDGAADAPRALEQYTRGRQLAPRDARLLALPGGASSFSGGSRRDWRHMREAEVLDPRSVDIAQRLIWPLLSSRRYAEALATAERARALAPSNLW